MHLPYTYNIIIIAHQCYHAMKLPNQQDQNSNSTVVYNGSEVELVDGRVEQD